ncbi:hypothetical protein [Gillisia sp. CAL575]|uniref:hypothetical protein n=1 Tax=Gillisia sp. CAL575 TaxID=985255 RepID=UPI0003A0D67B|nr:hypothetical protein [Gillisia sp. CAL575]
MYIEKELGIGVGIGVAVVFIGYLLYKKSSETSSNHEEIENRGEIEKAINSFIEGIIIDFYNEYRINYLGVRYNIKDLATENTYVFETKRVSSLSSIINYNQILTGEKYVSKVICKKYKIEVPVSDQLEFITEISRIEGKMRAVDSVKNLIPEEDSNRLKKELQEDLLHYKTKYSSNAL